MATTNATGLVPATTPISDLAVGVRGYVIEAFAYRKWTAKTMPTKENPTMRDLHFCCMLIDKQGHAIQANMDLNDTAYFHSKICLGKVYRISDFFCEKTTPYQQILPHPTTLKFGRITKFEQLESLEKEFPQHYFEFLSYNELSTRVPYKDEQQKTIYPRLTDYFGCLRAIGDLPPTGSQNIRRKIDIEDLHENVVGVTLWGALAAHFNKTEIEKQPPPVMIAVTACRASEYKGAIELSSTPATHYYINLPVTEFLQPRAAFIERLKRTPMLHVTKQHFQSPRAKEHRNTYSLCTLLTQNPASYKGITFESEATITAVFENKHWYYVSCNKCSKKVSQYEGTYTCIDHGDIESPEFRYSLKVAVDDGTAKAKFTLFSEAAVHIIGHNCSDLAQKYNMPEQRTIPTELSSIVGQKRKFIIQFAPKTPKGAGEFNVNTVLKVENVIQEHEPLHLTNETTTPDTPVLPTSPQANPATPPENIVLNIANTSVETSSEQQTKGKTTTAKRPLLPDLQATEKKKKSA